MLGELRGRAALRSSPVAEAFGSVPREAFLPGVPLETVYRVDRAVPTRFDGHGISISSASAPSIMAVMLERLDCKPGHRVLEIGAGTGYNAALLAHLVGLNGHVVTLELDADTTASARQALSKVACSVDVRHADGWQGAPDAAPFDRIIVTAGIWDVSPAWIEQLRPGGRMIAPLWIGPGLELAVTADRVGDGLSSVAVDWCGFMRLRGEHAGPEHWTSVGEWTATTVNDDPEPIARLGELLDTAPNHRRSLGPLPALWFARLAARDPDAIQLVHAHHAGRRAWGIFRAAESNLALVEETQLCAWGHGGAATELERYVHTSPVDLTRAAININNSGAPVSPDTLVLHRTHHRITISDLA